MPDSKKQVCRVRCTSADPFMSGYRYGFRAVQSDQVPDEQNLGGVTLEILRPLSEERKPEYELGAHYDVTMTPVPKTQAETAAQGLIIDPAAAGPSREDIAPVVTKAGKMPADPAPVG